MNEAAATIGRDLGRIFQALAGLLFVSLLVPLVWGEYWAMPALLVSGLVPFVIGYALTARFQGAAQPSKLHGMIIAATGWFCVAVFGSVPFLLIAWTVEIGLPVIETPSQTATLAAF